VISPSEPIVIASTSLAEPMVFPSPIIISSVKVAIPVTPKVPDTVALPTTSISVAVILFHQ